MGPDVCAASAIPDRWSGLRSTANCRCWCLAKQCRSKLPALLDITVEWVEVAGTHLRCTVCEAQLAWRPLPGQISTPVVAAGGAGQPTSSVVTATTVSPRRS